MTDQNRYEPVRLNMKHQNKIEPVRLIKQKQIVRSQFGKSQFDSIYHL